ncbi:MAG TPA: Ycf66 family protein [Leptolyngbyaceae cyanobacterium]
MINVNFNLASMSGIVLAVAGTALYAMRSWRPELSRDHDIFFSAVSLLCGGILLVYGWRFDPIMQFGQVLLTGATIFFAVENVRLRKVSTEQAKRNTPIVDDERRVSREYKVYRADLEELAPPEEDIDISRPRIRGSQDSRSSRNGYDSQNRRRPSSRGSDLDRIGSEGEVRRKRRPRPEIPPELKDDWGDVREDTSNDEEVSARRPSNRPPRSDNRRPETTSSRPRRRSATDVSSERPTRSTETKPTGDYVDYQPINPNEEEDNSSNFDY